MSQPTEIKVRGYHLDYYGHVNNARYLEFLEEARWNYFDQHLDLAQWQRSGRLFLVVNININYRHPVSLGARLQIDTRLHSWGHKSGVLHQKILQVSTSKPVADAAVTFVIADAGTGKALPLDAKLRAFFR
jgi:thioesterase III